MNTRVSFAHQVLLAAEPFVLPYVLFVCMFVLVYLFRNMVLLITYTGLKFVILLPPPPKCGDNRLISLCIASYYFFQVYFVLVF